MHVLVRLARAKATETPNQLATQTSRNDGGVRLFKCLPTFFIRGASATVPSRFRKASPFCWASVRFIADACGIFTGFGHGVGEGLGSPLTVSAADEVDATGFVSFLFSPLSSALGVTGDTAANSLVGMSFNSTSAIFAATTCTDIATISQSPFFQHKRIRVEGDGRGRRKGLWLMSFLYCTGKILELC